MDPSALKSRSGASYGTSIRLGAKCRLPATLGSAPTSSPSTSQRNALTAAGCERLFTDQLFGVRDDRPGLAALLTTPVLATWWWSWLSTASAVRCPTSSATIEALTEAGVLLRSLREGTDYSTATGRSSPASSPPWRPTSASS